MVVEQTLSSPTLVVGSRKASARDLSMLLPGVHGSMSSKQLDPVSMMTMAAEGLYTSRTSADNRITPAKARSHSELLLKKTKI